MAWSSSLSNNRACSQSHQTPPAYNTVAQLPSSTLLIIHTVMDTPQVSETSPMLDKHADEHVAVQMQQAIDLGVVSTALSNQALLAMYYTTGAKMTVYNDTAASLSVDTSNSDYMKNNFPKSEIAPGGSQEHDVSVSLLPWQSWFETTFNGGHTIRTELGSGYYDTSASPQSFADGQVASMVSPLLGTSWQLDYFVGPGLVQNIVNNFVQANLPAIIDYINTKGIDTVQKGITFSLSGLQMRASDLVCPYASIVPSGKSALNVNAIVKIKNKTSITASIKNVPGNVSVPDSLSASLTDVGIVIRARVPLDGGSIELTEIKFSLGNFSLPWELWAILIALTFIYPLSIPVLTALRVATTGILFASILNNGAANDGIRAAINGALKGVTISGSLAGGYFEATELAQSAMAATFDPNNAATWMSSDTVQGTALQNLHLPGSHDSGSYSLSKDLPRLSYPAGKGIKYREIAFLWALKPGPAPSNGNFPFPTGPISDTNPLYIGQWTYDFILDTIVRDVSQAGDRDFTQQLTDGLRWFDLRIYHDDDGEFYMQHGLRGPLYTDVLKQIKTYLDTYKESKELIFVNLSHADFNGDALQTVADLTAQHIPADNILYRSNDMGSEEFNFQALANQPISSLTQGKTKLMFINQDASRTYPSPITNTAGFGSKEKQDALWSQDFCQQTPDSARFPYVVAILAGRRPGTPYLRALATEKNGTLEGWLVNNPDPKDRGAMIPLDWYEYSTGKAPVPQILALNPR